MASEWSRKKMKLRNFPECRVKGKRERRYKRHEEEILKSQKERTQRTHRTIFWLNQENPRMRRESQACRWHHHGVVKIGVLSGGLSVQLHKAWRPLILQKLWCIWIYIPLYVVLSTFLKFLMSPLLSSCRYFVYLYILPSCRYFPLPLYTVFFSFTSYPKNDHLSS